MKKTFRTWKYDHVEPSGKSIVGLTVVGEGPEALRNVGDRSNRRNKWVEITRAYWEFAFQRDQVEFVSFSRRAALAIRKHEPGSINFWKRSTVRDQAFLPVYD